MLALPVLPFNEPSKFSFVHPSFGFSHDTCIGFLCRLRMIMGVLMRLVLVIRNLEIAGNMATMLFIGKWIWR